MDILIFAIIAAFLVYRLYGVVGTRHGDERPRQNPFAMPEAEDGRPALSPVPLKPVEAPKPLRQRACFDALMDPVANKEGRVEAGLEEIAAADTSFDAGHFIAGAKFAFEAIVSAYNAGDRARLRSLLSPKLFADFDADIKTRESLGHTSETIIHRIKAARIVEAHLGGTMAYITVDYDVEQSATVRDKTGAVVHGNPDSISNVEDIWTFTRDVRSADPNWILIETRAAEK